MSFAAVHGEKQNIVVVFCFPCMRVIHVFAACFFRCPRERKLRWLEGGGGHLACGTRSRYTGYTGWSAWRTRSHRLLRHRIVLLLLAGCVAAANQTSRCCCCLSSARNECTAGGIEPEHASLTRRVSLSRTSDVYADVCPPERPCGSKPAQRASWFAHLSCEAQSPPRSEEQFSG